MSEDQQPAKPPGARPRNEFPEPAGGKVESATPIAVAFFLLIAGVMLLGMWH